MRIAISAEGPSLDTKVGDRFGTSNYLLIVDVESGEVEAVINPGASSPTHSGIKAIIMVISRKPDVLLTGYLSPTAEKHLTTNGIRVVKGQSGLVSEALERYKQCVIEDHSGLIESPMQPPGAYRAMLISTIKNSARQLGGALPVMMAVILLIGLFQAYLGKELIASMLSGKGLWDTFWGAVAGSLFAGNAITSYIIGGELLEQGVSVLAVTAFLVAWVTVGLFQLPAEIDSLGMRFALIRNSLSFVASLCIAGATVAACRFLIGAYP